MKTIFYTITLIFSMLFFNSCATRVQSRPVRKTVTVIKVAPKNHRVIHVKGKKYYKWNNTHYRKTKKGFVVVRL